MLALFLACLLRWQDPPRTNLVAVPADQLKDIALAARTFEEGPGPGLRVWGGTIGNYSDLHLASITLGTQIIYADGTRLNKDVTVAAFDDAATNIKDSVLPGAAVKFKVEASYSESELQGYTGYWADVKSAEAIPITTDFKDMSDIFAFALVKDGDEVMAALRSQPKLFNGFDRKSGSQLIHAIAANGTAEQLAFYLSKGADLNKNPGHGQKPIHSAAVSGNLETVRELLKRGVSAEEPNRGGFFPMHHAAIALRGGVEMIELLHEHGARIDPELPGLETPLAFALRAYRTNTAVRLIQLGANVRKNDAQHEYPMAAAVCFIEQDVLEALLAAGADINATDPETGGTPLHRAISHGHVASALWLVQHGASLKLKDRRGLTPLELALKVNANPEVIARLKG